MNHLTLLGTLAKPSTYYCTDKGRDMLRFTVITGGAANSSASRFGTAYYPAVTHHHCIAWGPAALDLHTNLKTNDRVMIHGELHYRTHRNRRGDLRRFAEIYVRGYSYLGAEEQGVIPTFARPSDVAD